jgi:RimJ/RimL family protein N-acetyltransferase
MSCGMLDVSYDFHFCDSVRANEGTDYLAPSHQGRGVTTAAVRTLITQWGIPWMKARCISSSTFDDNPGSLRVLQKNGFAIVNTLVEHIEAGGKKRTVHLLERQA